MVLYNIRRKITDESIRQARAMDFIDSARLECYSQPQGRSLSNVWLPV